MSNLIFEFTQPDKCHHMIRLQGRNEGTICIQTNTGRFDNWIVNLPCQFSIIRFRLPGSSYVAVRWFENSINTSKYTLDYSQGFCIDIITGSTKPVLVNRFDPVSYSAKFTAFHR